MKWRLAGFLPAPLAQGLALYRSALSLAVSRTLNGETAPDSARRRVSIHAAVAVSILLLFAVVGAKPNPSVKDPGKGKGHTVTTAQHDELIVTPVGLDDGTTVDIVGGTLPDGSGMVADFQPELKAGQKVKKAKHGAFWRLVPEDSKDSWFGETVAHAYTWTGHRWKDNTLRYYVNTTNPAPPSPMTPTSTIAAIESATLRWIQQTNAKITVVSMGLTTNSTISNNGHNDVFYRDKSDSDPPGRAASTIYYFGADGFLRDADMVKYKGYGTFYPTGTCVVAPYHQAEDDILTHEVGHMFGFGHSSVGGATMWPSIPAQCDSSWRSLSADDIAAARAAYGVKP